MTSTIFPREFDSSKLAIGTLKTLDSGARTAYVSYDGQPLRIQTPMMTSPFGISRFTATHKATLSLSLASDSLTNAHVMTDVLTAFDAKVLEIAHERSVELFKAQKSPAQLEDRYTASVRPAKDAKYPATFKVSVPEKDGKFIVAAWDLEDKPLDINQRLLTPPQLPIHTQLKGTRMAAIVSPTVLWSAGTGNFGVSWKLVGLKCAPISLQTCTGFRT